MSYLKGLGIFRLVAEQRDPDAAISWKSGHLVLHTSLSKEELTNFFLNDYQPSPILAPWGARSGFYPGSSETSAREALQAIEQADHKRLKCLKFNIHKVKGLLKAYGFKDKPTGEADKLKLLELCRASLNDEALNWLDAVYVLTSSGRKYPHILGTGGNEGSGSYVSGFSQQVVQCLVKREFDSSISSSLFCETHSGVLSSQSPGHFSPFESGGVNSTSNSDQGPASTNPWDYLLCLEGTLMLASSCARRFASNDPQEIAFPFAVHAVGAGYPSESQQESYDTKSARSEVWLPLWKQAIGLPELKMLFNEGRAKVGGRAAQNAIDFALALGNLGVDRGISAFVRYAFLKRYGDNFFAVPLDTLKVANNLRLHSILEVTTWVNRLRNVANKKKPQPPASLPPHQRQIDRAILVIVHEVGNEPRKERLQDVLIALGAAERQLNRTLHWSREKGKVQPIPALSQRWRSEADTGAAEYRLAASLASSFLHRSEPSGRQQNYTPFRLFMENVEVLGNESLGRVTWLKQPGRNTCWTEGSVVDSMHKVMRRLLVLHAQEGRSEWSFTSHTPASLLDIERFLLGGEHFDDAYFEQCLWGLILLRWHHGRDKGEKQFHTRKLTYRVPPALYSTLKLCFAGHPLGEGKQRTSVKLRPDIFHLAATGDAPRATEAASIRLRANGLAPALKDPLFASTKDARRAAAALLFPISKYGTTCLAKTFLTCGTPAEEDDQPFDPSIPIEHQPETTSNI